MSPVVLRALLELVREKLMYVLGLELGVARNK